MWPWFYHFMGDIEFKNYIPGFADGMVHVEDTGNVCMQHVPENFMIEKEEWYTYNASPRNNVHVIASVDENTYQPNSTTKMGDHPVIWTNTKYKAKNIYIFMGHSPALFDNVAYTTMFRNAICWAAKK
jgi:type 1 glutamine amidotransferase